MVKQDFDLTVSAYYVLDVLKKKFRLSYRKIRRVPFSGNSERNLVLRSLYAQRMLPLYHSKKRIINVDESWIVAADFHYKSWKRRGMLNSAPEKKLWCRKSTSSPPCRRTETSGSLSRPATRTATC